MGWVGAGVRSLRMPKSLACEVLPRPSVLVTRAVFICTSARSCFIIEPEPLPNIGRLASAIGPESVRYFLLFRLSRKYVEISLSTHAAVCIKVESQSFRTRL